MGERGCGWSSLYVFLSLGLLFQFFSPISQLKSVCELDKVKGLKLKELWLEENPLCSTFPDQSTYTSLVITIVTFPGNLCPLGAKLPLTVPLSGKQQLWSPGKTTGPALSYLNICVSYLSLEVSFSSSDLLTCSLV